MMDLFDMLVDLMDIGMSSSDSTQHDETTADYCKHERNDFINQTWRELVTIRERDFTSYPVAAKLAMLAAAKENPHWSKEDLQIYYSGTLKGLREGAELVTKAKTVSDSQKAYDEIAKEAQKSREKETKIKTNKETNTCKNTTTTIKPTQNFTTNSSSTNKSTATTNTNSNSVTTCNNTTTENNSPFSDSNKKKRENKEITKEDIQKFIADTVDLLHSLQDSIF